MLYSVMSFLSRNQPVIRSFSSRRPYPLLARLTLVAVLAGGGFWLPPPSQADDLFLGFTGHIRGQIDRDKLAFAEVSRCTEWFYQRERRKPPKSIVDPVLWSSPYIQSSQEGRSVDTSSECDSKYPGGLTSVRDAFSRAQSTLSVSLTFYEFALVGDGDDNSVYSAEEVRDLLHSLKIPSSPAQSSSAALAALNGTFDSFRLAGNLDGLMTSIGVLYEQGYRFTPADRAELDRVMR
jgi:hypothetical protein